MYFILGRGIARKIDITEMGYNLADFERINKRLIKLINLL